LGRAEEKPVTIEVFITDETTKTIQVDYKDQVTWLQKSLVKIKQQDGNKVTITIPLWLFTRKFPRLKY
jgi:hypothetical protein